MNTPKYIVQYQDDYADEFYIQGWKLFDSQESLTKFLCEVQKKFISPNAPSFKDAKGPLLEEYRQEIRAELDYGETAILVRAQEGKDDGGWIVENAKNRKLLQADTSDPTVLQAVQKLYSKKYNPGHEFYFGTNEFVKYDNYEQLMKHFSIEEISDEEYNILLRRFGSTYGIVPF